MSERSSRRSESHQPRFLAPSLVNLGALIVALCFFMTVEVGPLSPYGSDVWARPFYFIGQAVFLWAIGWLGATALLRLGLKPRLVQVAWAAYFTVVFVFLYADYLVIYLYGIHMHEQFMRLAQEPGILEDLGMTGGSLLKVGLAVLLLLVSQLALFRIPWRCKVVAVRRLSTGVSILVPILVFCVWSMTHQVHPRRAAADAEYVPLFLPGMRGWNADALWSMLGVERIGRAPGVGFESEDDSAFDERVAYLAFRRQFELPESMTCENPWNILVLGAESWRFDMLAAEVMPRLWSLTQQRGFVSEGHYSTGNRTPEGVFGLFSGLSPIYWKACSDERLNPPFFSCLKKLGYTNRVYTSSTFAYGDVDQFVFGEGIDLMDVVNSQKHGETTLQWKRRPLEVEDQIITDRFCESLSVAAGDERRMDFVYFYVTHYNYYYPDAFEKFRPAMGSDFTAHDFTLRARRDEAFNRYRNACFYLDHLLGQVFDALKATDRWKNTIVVITGDHGEEFFEAGRFGHSVALNNYQTRVPFVMIFPEPAPIKYTVTSHADVVPTLLAGLGVKPALDRLHTGKNLLDFSPDKNAALIMNLLGHEFPTQYAIVKDDFKLHVVNGEDRVAVEHRTDTIDRVLETLPASKEESALQWMMEQKRWFR